jgi:hypothetical protein
MWYLQFIQFTLDFAPHTHNHTIKAPDSLYSTPFEQVSELALVQVYLSERQSFEQRLGS